jgi:RluA family pseudouridine synthase
LAELTCTVPDDLSGVRFQDFLERTWPSADRTFLRRLVRDGLATVNYEGVHGHRRLKPGDFVRLELPEGLTALPDHRGPKNVVDPDRPAALEVLAENDLCLVLDKPPGLPCVPDRAGRTSGVHGMLPSIRPDEDLRIAHRIDRYTSGCLAIAKGIEGARWLDLCFRERRAEKAYLALVEGVVRRDAFPITRALGPDRKRPGKVTVVAAGQKRSRDAHTDIEVVERFAAHTLLVARPRTGRGHQIRAHLRSIGHPIVGDVDYGSKGPLHLSDIKRGYKARTGAVEKPLLERMFLHAHRIRLPMPEDGVALEAEAQPPADLALVLDKLRRFSSPRDARMEQDA